MATSAVAGFKGIVKASSATSTGPVIDIAEVREFTITREMSEIDATSHDSSGQRETIPGTRSWNGAAEYLQVMGSSQHQNLFDSIDSSDPLLWEFYPTGSSSDGYFDGDAHITSWELASPNEDALLTNVNFVGTGALTRSSSST